MPRRGSSVLVALALVILGTPNVDATQPRSTVVSVEVLTTNSGRVDWAPDGQSLAIDRVDDEGSSTCG